MEKVRLNDGNYLDRIGFGTYKSTNDQGYKVIVEAINAGYRLLDSASAYGNEEDIAKAMKESGINRQELQISSKLDRNKMGYESTIREVEKSLLALDVDYLDLYLLHWPRSSYGSSDFDDWKRLDIESWMALEKLQKEGKIKSIGVSNFLPHHLDNLLENCSVVPAVDQLELHPGYLQAEAVNYCKEHNIVLEAYSPMARGRLNDNELMNKLALKYNCSITHLCLVYLYQQGIIVLPKTTNYQRMLDNIKLDDIVISQEDIWQIKTMPQAGYSGEHPDYKRVYF